MSSITVKTIDYYSEGVRCAADLYLPAASGKPGPAIVVAHGFTSVKEMSVEVGTFLAENGYVAMVIDYRNFGASDGEVRGELFPLREVEDVRSAVTHLETLAEVDAEAIGVWGTSFGGGVVIYAAAIDRRIKAVMSQVPIMDGRRWHIWQRTGIGYDQLLRELEEDRRARYRGELSRRIPCIGLQGSDTVAGHMVDKEIADAMVAYQDMLPSWSATMPIQSLEKIIEFSPMSMIHHISPRPLLIVGVSGYDIVHSATDIAEGFDLAREPKEMLFLPYSQFGLYGGEGLQVALGHHLAFYRKYLPLPAA